MSEFTVVAIGVFGILGGGFIGFLLILFHGPLEALFYKWVTGGFNKHQSRHW
jgi:hypothetical protein